MWYGPGISSSSVWPVEGRENPVKSIAGGGAALDGAGDYLDFGTGFAFAAAMEILGHYVVGGRRGGSLPAGAGAASSAMPDNW